MSHVQAEPPKAATTAAQRHFIVGQDPHGWWLAIETHNLGGGLFKSRADAIAFVDVDVETGRRQNAFELATAPLQLTF